MLCASALPQFSYHMLSQGYTQDFRNVDVTVQKDIT